MNFKYTSFSLKYEQNQISFAPKQNCLKQVFLHGNRAHVDLYINAIFQDSSR